VDNGGHGGIPSSASSSLSVKKGESEGRLPKPKDQAEVVAYCESIGLPAKDANYFWNKWIGDGFKNAGRPMRDWQAVIRSWRDAGHLPSQKNEAKHQQNSQRQMSVFEIDKRILAINDEINRLHREKDSNPNAADKIAELKSRRADLKRKKIE
jgi:uncharacterized small protein (DUF1192 family)